MTKFACSLDGMQWTGKYINETIAMREFAKLKNIEPGTNFYLAHVVENRVDFDMTELIDQIVTRAAQKHDVAEGTMWLSDVPDTQLLELKGRICKMIDNWVVKKGYRPDFWGVEKVMQIHMPDKNVIQKKVANSIMAVAKKTGANI